MMICVLDDNNIIVNIITGEITGTNECNFYEGCEVGKVYDFVNYAKQRYIEAAGAEFARRRDAITWTQHEVGLYGYDRKPEDVTNFLAAMKRAEIGLSTGFNVYVNNADNPKQFLPHTYDMFKVVLEQSANEQIVAYQWYEGIKGQLNADTVKTIVDLEAIFPLNG